MRTAACPAPLPPPTVRPSHLGHHLLPLLGRPLGAFLLLLAAVFAVYAPSLNGQFLWDDNSLVKGNLLIRSPLFCLEIFRHTLFDDASNFYRPTQTLTFLIDYWFGGLDPYGYHLTSVLIHGANAFLLCLTLRLVLPTVLPSTWIRGGIHILALGIALVWAVHPVHSAAVAYISGTADTLAMTLCLSAVLLCEQAMRSPRRLLRAVFGAGAFLGLLLGLCAKEIASVWLLLFLGYMFALRANTTRRARWTVVAFALVAVLTYLGLRHLAPVPPPSPALPPMPSKAVLMLRALGDYGSLLLFPKKLFMERQVFAAPNLVNAEDEFFYHTLAVTGALLLTAFAAGTWWPGRGRNLRRLGAAWFMIGFLPISNLFALNASVAEHWLYLPSIGFLLFLVGVGLDLPPLLPGPRGTRLVVGAVVVLVGAFGLRTWYRTFDWADELTFFRQTIADGGDVPRARAGLAAAYGRQAITDGNSAADAAAIVVLRRMVEQYPNVVAQRINLATSLARRGDTDEARTILEAAAASLFARRGKDPHEILTVLKGLDLLEGDSPAWPDHRRALLDRGLQWHPSAWELVRYGIQDCERRAQLPEGLALAQRFTEAHWWHAPAHLTLGDLQAKLAHPAEALSTWEQASRLDVHDTEALNRAAELCLQSGQLNLAHDLQARAVQRQPDSPRQHALFAQVLESQGDPRAREQIDLANALVAQSRPKSGSDR